MQAYEKDDGLFHTEAFHAEQAARATKAERCKKVGEPIECPSKIISFEINGQDAWTAESGWVARKVDLRTGKAKMVLRGHEGPVTCLATFEDTVNARTIVFTGSWDKTIKTWDGQTGGLLSTTKTHTDFVKALVVIPWLNILISGSSDKSLQVYDLFPLLTPSPEKIDLSAGLQRIAQSKIHSRPIDCFELEPQTERESAGFFSGDSLGAIRRWVIKRDKGMGGMALNSVDELKGHHTSISQMRLGEGGLWTASIDKAVLFHSLPRSNPPKAPISIPHPSYVKSLLLVPSTFHPSFPLLLTGSSDEHIRVYDISNILERSTQAYSEQDMPRARQISTVEGHWLDVTCMREWVRETEKGKEPWVISSSLDATFRRWSMQDLLHPPPIPETVVQEKGSGMTAEEVQELADMMSDD